MHLRSSLTRVPSPGGMPGDGRTRITPVDFFKRTCGHVIRELTNHGAKWAVTVPESVNPNVLAALSLLPNVSLPQSACTSLAPALVGPSALADCQTTGPECFKRWLGAYIYPPTLPAIVYLSQG